MKISLHSKRLAIFLSLGVMFFVPLVAKPAYAQEMSLSFPQQPLSSTSEYCSYSTLIKLQKTYEAFTLLPYGQTTGYLANAIIISEPQDPFLRSISPAKTILKKVNENHSQKEEEITVTPLPVQATSTSASVAWPALSESTPSKAALSAEKLFAFVNVYRASIGLAPFQQDGKVCAIVSSRAPELDNEIYGSSYMHAGFQARNLPYFATENMISMQTEEQALNWWLNSSVHRSAIQGNYQYACIACAGKSCAMIFTNFDSKYPQLTPTPLVAVTQ